jgi:hypothetical protein
MYFNTLPTVLLPCWPLREGVRAAPVVAVEVTRLPKICLKRRQLLNIKL